MEGAIAETVEYLLKEIGNPFIIVLLIMYGLEYRRNMRLARSQRELLEKLFEFTNRLVERIQPNDNRN